MLELRHVCKSFQEGEARRTVFDDLSLNIRSGAFTAITGRSGTNYVRDLIALHPDCEKARAPIWEDFFLHEAAPLFEFDRGTVLKLGAYLPAWQGLVGTRRVGNVTGNLPILHQRQPCFEFRVPCRQRK